MSRQLRAVISALGLLLTAGCGGGGVDDGTVTIGGTVTGLVGTVVLQNNAGDNLSVMTNGAFTFATRLSKVANYAVTILTQPPGPTCVVSNGSGVATDTITSVSVTCTTDPATVFLPIAASDAAYGQAVHGTTGLFVVSSKSPGDPPIQITTEAVESIALQPQYTLSAQGAASTVSPYALMYTTLKSSSGDHVWSLNLSGMSSLVPKQLSTLTIPYHETLSNHGARPAQFCGSWVIPKNLADPSSAFLILALPTDDNLLCGGSPADFKWVLIHSSDGPTTPPVDLPALSLSILPLYRPDGALAGIVTTDSANDLNFYPDETFANPQLLLANAVFFFEQEPYAGPIFGVSANPTYGFLLVRHANAPMTGPSVYRVDYSGSISADLYDLQSPFGEGKAVYSGDLYFADVSQSSGAYLESVGRVPGGGGPVQMLGSTSAQSDSWLPFLVAVGGSKLVFGAATELVPYGLQGSVLTLPTDAPGTFTRLASVPYLPDISLVDGDIFVSIPFQGGASSDAVMQYNSQILDLAGNNVQAYTPASYFTSHSAPMIQVRNITDSNYLGGGGLYVLDLSQPSAPVPVALKTTGGTPFILQTGTQNVYFRPVTSNIGVSDSVTVSGVTGSSVLVYDLAKALVVPISIPSSNLQILIGQPNVLPEF